MYRAERNAIIDFYAELHNGDFGKTRAAYIDYVNIIQNLHDAGLPFYHDAARRILDEYRSAKLAFRKKQEERTA